jgi:hypothetical protein
MIQGKVRALCFVSFGLLLFGCSKKDKGKNVEAKLTLANSTGLNLTDTDCPELGSDGFKGDQCWTPSSFGLKIVTVYISPDASGATSAPAGLIWANPACGISVSSTDIGDKSFEYESASDCTDSQVSDYFELARTSDQVNAELNSQPHKILPGTYNYVAMEFCKGGPSGDNTSFIADGMTEAYTVKSGTCGISSVKADPPIVVAEGQSVNVTLYYDLTNIIYQKEQFADPKSCYVSEDESIVRCASYPRGLVPGFVQE